ncbi:MAG: hypothetical protein IPL78_05970 [Chloroflexi bacterium]|nr:hypothetical protein [Chloroflexota bacterium]
MLVKLNGLLINLFQQLAHSLLRARMNQLGAISARAPGQSPLGQQGMRDGEAIILVDKIICKTGYQYQ